MAHQVAFGTNAFKKHHELEFEEDDRINGRTTLTCIGLLHELTHEREVEGAFQMAIEVVRWY